MNREVFLKMFQEALMGKVSNQIIQDNLNYYNNYFNEQMRFGKTEAEIISMLGDPRLLAKTVEDSNNFSLNETATGNYYEKDMDQQQKLKKIKFRIGIAIAIVIAVLVILVLVVLNLLLLIHIFFIIIPCCCFIRGKIIAVLNCFCQKSWVA